ncbi:hypothetical protein EV385_1606 [Krasilnikovia cinnamomea]|uniref:Uncharacterized protein n=1 Tax=Krasilnikovia cinnamomea TaxID=349313 RepID=A0A4Q7ZIC0_9ACTN|nr:hypothetical protein [Krasilnikovia cinnamomea]RZU49849.1 hypothetical protein EV385_1606 [Krasilnikovia cinnamomea]
MSKNGRTLAFGAGLGIAATLLSVAVAPTAALANDRTVTRAGCKFDFHSGANYSYTSKRDFGTCNGHAWIRVHWENGVTSSWRHDPKFISEGSYGGTGEPSDYQITWSEHKTQSNESAWRGRP